MRFLKNNEIESIKEYLRKENARLTLQYFRTNNTETKIKIAKQIKENLEYLYVNKYVKGATR